MSDPRKDLPPGVNSVDMGWDGKRFSLLCNYGSIEEKQLERTINNCLQAWQVVDTFDIQRYRKTKNNVGYSSGRAFMLKFKDGKWRYGTFTGSNGPICAHCDWDAFEAESGELAYLNMCIEIKNRHVLDAKARYDYEQHELEKLLQIKKILEE